MPSAEKTLVDAGPLVAILDGDDAHHAACASALQQTPGRFYTVWPAVAEAMHLLGFSAAAQDALLEWIDSEALHVSALEASDMPRARELMRRYRDLPMDFADAALVRVAEREGIRRIFTVDARDFRLYRPRHVRSFQIIPAP